MIVKIDDSQIRRMKAAIEGTARELRKELEIAVNKTANKAKSIIAKQIAKELNVPQNAIKSKIRSPRRAGPLSITAEVALIKDARIGLQYFQAKQTKQGVSYKISKTEGRKTAPGAFISEKLYGGVFKRRGKTRLKIDKLKGPSPWGVFVVGKKIGPSADEIEVELKKQVDDRVKFLLLKQAGTI